MDTQLFLRINDFAKSTPFAHGFAREYAIFIGLVLLGLALIATVLRAILAGRGADTNRQIAVAGVTGIAAIVAFAINQPISHAINRPRPFLVLHHVEVLIPRAHDGGMPSDHATVAGAVMFGLWLSKDRLVAVIATVVGILLAFDRVYVGAHYPSDVLTGIGLGAVTFFLCHALLTGAAARVIGRLRDGQPSRRSSLLEVPVTPIGRTAVGSTEFVPPGSVKLLSEQPLRPARRNPPSEGTPLSDVTSS